MVHRNISMDHHILWLHAGDEVRQYLIGPPGPPGPPGVPGGYGFNTQEVAGRVLRLMNGRSDVPLTTDTDHFLKA